MFRFSPSDETQFFIEKRTKREKFNEEENHRRRKDGIISQARVAGGIQRGSKMAASHRPAGSHPLNGLQGINGRFWQHPAIL
jgi:hypothetical protein